MFNTEQILFGKVIVSEAVPPGTIYFIPPIDKKRVKLESTGEEIEVCIWTARQGAVVSGIRDEGE